MKLSFDYFSVLMQVSLIGLPVYWLFYKNLAASGRVAALEGQVGMIRFLKVAGLVLLSNACVHPLVFFGFMSSGKSYLWAMLMGQAFAVIGNSVLQSWAARVPFSRALAASFVANLISWQFTSLLIYGLYY